MDICCWLFSVTIYATFIIWPITASSLFNKKQNSENGLKRFHAKSQLNGANYRQHVHVVTSTVYKTNTITERRKTTVTLACARLVNVTGHCKHRRGRWLEEPIVVSFDDEIDKAVDILYTPVIKVLTTQSPHLAELENDLSTPPGISDHLKSSMTDSDDEGTSRQPRIFFREIFDFMANFLPSRVSTSTSTTVWTLTLRKTTSSVETYRTTNTFFVQRCTPSPFPFSLCHRRHNHTVHTEHIKGRITDYN